MKGPRWVIWIIWIGVLWLLPLVGFAQTDEDYAARARELRAQSQAQKKPQLDEARQLFESAFKLFQQGDFSTAKIAFGRGFALDPGNGTAHFYMAETLMRMKESATAREQYGLALALLPSTSTESLKAGSALAKFGAKGSKDCAECPEMVVIPAGAFNMGSSGAEQALANAAGVSTQVTAGESPQRGVSVRSFAAGRYAVTRGEFANFVRARNYQTEAEQGDGCYGLTGTEFKKDKAHNWRNVGFSQSDDHPVVCVSWNDAKAYAQWISQVSGKEYRLLSEAEREYAARAGTQTAFWWGGSINSGQANYNGAGKSYNSSAPGDWRRATVAVNSFEPNPFGLYNVHGNVWEWVEDCWHENYNGAPTDGSAWTTGCSQSGRVLRGGSWMYIPAYLRSAGRLRGTPDLRGDLIGFRLARTLSTP